MNQSAQALKIDERNHVEKPFLDQLHGLGWQIIDLDKNQKPKDSDRESFTEVVMGQVLRHQLKVINSWLEPDQIEEVIKQLTANFPSNNLLENNRHLFTLLQENTSVSENRKTGEKSPTVKFVDFANTSNNSFIAVCQFKIRILGTDHHIIPDIVLFLNGLPVVVIECKSPKVQDAIAEEIDQLMMFMVRAMYRHPNLSQWKVVFVTDRTQLEQQLAETGQNIGFTVKPADSIAKPKELLRSDSSDLVMAMIHKFQERDL